MNVVLLDRKIYMDVLKYYGKFYPYNTFWMLIILLIMRILYYFLKPYLPPREETQNV